MPKSSYEHVKAWRARQPNLTEIRREEARKWRLAHPEKVKEIAARFKAKHAVRLREEDKLKKREWRKANPSIQEKYIRTYWLKIQKNRETSIGRVRPTWCEICGSAGYGNGSKPRAGICFDHDHKTGKARGWLCDRCNKVLGLVKDSSNLLAKLRRYLENGEIEFPGEECSPDQGLCRAGT